MRRFYLFFDIETVELFFVIMDFIFLLGKNTRRIQALN
jgi:hypothetical protein